MLRIEQHREEGRRRIAAAVPRDEVLRQLAPWREAHKRRAWKPITEPGDRELTASKFSGAAWLRKGEMWPTCSGCQHPMQLFLQLNLGQLPRELQGRYGDGLLQLFYCAYTEGGGCTAAISGYEAFKGPKVVRVVQPDPMAHRQVMRADEGHFPPKTIVGWDGIDDYPNPQDHDELGLEYCHDFSRWTVDVSCTQPNMRFENQSSGMAEAISCALRGEKLSGWPCWIQHADYPRCPRCGRRMEVIFQIDSNDNLHFMFSDAGCGHITQCPEHKEVVTFAWACS